VSSQLHCLSKERGYCFSGSTPYAEIYHDIRVARELCQPREELNISARTAFAQQKRAVPRFSTGGFLTSLNVSSDYVEEKASTVNVIYKILASLEHGINDHCIQSTHENYRSFYEKIVDFNDPSKEVPKSPTPSAPTA